MTSEHAESVNYLWEIIGKVLENFELLSNIRAIHNENLSSCKECGKNHKTCEQGRLNAHRRKYTGDNKECPICNKVIKRHLQRHIDSKHLKSGNGYFIVKEK